VVSSLLSVYLPRRSKQEIPIKDNETGMEEVEESKHPVQGYAIEKVEREFVEIQQKVDGEERNRGGSSTFRSWSIPGEESQNGEAENEHPPASTY
jgi:hypothetical protein